MFVAAIRNPEAKNLPVERWIRTFLRNEGHIFTEKHQKFMYRKFTVFNLASGGRIEVLQGPNLTVHLGPVNDFNEKRLEELKTGISSAVLEEFKKSSLGFLYSLTQKD